MARINTVFSLTDNVSSSLRNIATNVNNSVRGFESFSGKLVAINSSIDLLSKGLSMISRAGSFFGKFVSDAGEYESLLVRLTVATGDAIIAQEEFQKLKDFAKTSPFDLPGVVQASIMFRNAGIEADKLIPTIKMLGDVAQGNNDYFNRMAINFMQIKSAGKATMQDLNQFAYMGIPIKQVLKDIGVTGVATFEDIEKAFKIMTSQGGQFYNSMSSNSGTMSGQLSNMRDAIQQFSASIGNKLLPSITSVVQKFGNFMSQLSDLKSFNSIIDNFGKKVQQLEQQFGGLIATVINLGTVLVTVSTILAVQWAVANATITATILLMVSIVRLLNDIINKTNEASGAMTGFGNQCARAGEIFGAVVGFIAGTLSSLMNIIYNVLATVYNAVIYISEFVLNLFQNPVNAIGRLFIDLGNLIIQVLSTVAGAIDALFNTSISKTLNNASALLENFKKTHFGDVGFNYTKAQLKDVSGIKSAITSGMTIGRDVGELLDKNFSIFKTEIENNSALENFDKLKVDSSGALVVSDKNTVNLADDFRNLLSEKAIQKFNLQYSQVTPNVTFGNIMMNNETDVETVIDKIIMGVQEAQMSSLRS